MAHSFSVRRVGLVLTVAIAVAAAAAWHYGLFAPFLARAPGNSIMVIAPYRFGGTWVFDDPAVGLTREPFVGGVPQMIDALVADVPNSDQGFRLYFAASPFPGYQQKLTWVRSDSPGNWYRMDEPPMEGWICPALFKYYDQAPRELFVKAEPKQ